MSKTPYLKSQTRQMDWCVVIPKLPESLEDRVAEKLIQHFSLTPQEAKETIQHTPIILLDDLDRDAASKVKAVFDGTGVELILTQDPSFKKKCFRVLWPKESAQVLSRWRGDASAAEDEQRPTAAPISAHNAELDAAPIQEHGQDDKGLRKRISELEARLKIAEARDKELQGELEKREKNNRSREEVLQQEKKVSQKLQGLFDQGQKESTDWMRKAEQAHGRIKTLEAEKNDLSEKLQARVREVGNWKVKSDQMDAEREDLSKQLDQKNRELDQRQRAFEQQLAEFDKKSTKDKSGYVDEKKQWAAIHEQFQQEVQAAQQKSAELTEQIKALRRNITDREEASKISAQSFKDVSRKNQAMQQKITQMEGQAFKLEKVREDLTRQLNQVSSELEEKNKVYEGAISVYEKRMSTFDAESKAEREQFAEEKKSLNQELENSRNEIAALVSHKAAVQDCLTETEKRCNQLMDSLDIAAKDQQGSLSRIDQLGETEGRLNSEIHVLQKQLASALQDKTAQEGSLQQLAARVSELEQLCSRQDGLLQSESAKLTQERDTVDRSAARIRQLEGEQLNLEKLLETSGVDYRDAVGRIAGLEKNLSDLTENQKSLEHQLRQRTEELDRWRQSAEQANADSSARQVRVDELEILKSHAEDHGSKLAASKAALELQRDDLMTQISELTETRTRLDTQKIELQNQIDDLSSSVKTLRGNLDKRTHDLEASLREREKQGAEWSAKYSELKEMADAEREALRAEQSRLENVLQAVREERTAALKDVSDLESRSAELEQQRVGLSRDLAEKTELLNQWTHFAEQSEAKAESRHKVIGELESVKADLLSERDALLKFKSQLEEDKQKLENCLAMTTGERDQLILLRQKLESQIAELQATSSKLAADLQSSIREREIQDEDWLSKYSQLKRSTDDERQTLSGEKQQLIRSVEGLSDDKEFAQKAISELELRISELHETRNLLERDVRDKSKELQQVTERAEESSSLVSIHQKKIESLEEQIIQLEVERHELTAELSAVKNEFDEMRLEKQHLEAAVERWSLEAKDLGAKFKAELEAHEVSRSQQAEQNTQWNQKYNDLAGKSAEDREVFEDERTRYEKTLAEIQNDKTEALKEIGRLEERIGSLDRQRIHLEEKLAEKSADYENYFSAKSMELQKWILHSEQAELESATRQKRIDELESIKSQLESERQSLTEALALMTQSRDSAQIEMNRLEVIYQTLQDQSGVISAQLAQKTEALKAGIQESKQQKIDGQKRFDELKNTAEAERQSLTNEKTRLEGVLAEVEREKAQALLRIETQEQSIQTLEGRCSALELDLNTKIEELQQWTGLAEQAEAAAESRQKEIEALQIVKARLEEERAVLFNAKEQLESQVELFSKNLSDAAMERERLVEIKQGLEKSVTSLASQLRELRDELEQNAKKLSDQERSQEKLNIESADKYDQLKASTDAERQVLLTDQQRLAAAVSALQADKSEALKEIGRLEGRIESLDESRENLEQSLRSKTEELSEWTQLAEQSELKAAQRQEKIDDLEMIRGELESERDGLANAKVELTDKYGQLSGIKTALESQRDSLLAAKEELENNQDELNKKISELTAVRKELAEWKENLETEVEKLEGQRSVLQAELEKRTQELELSRCEGKDQEVHWNLKFNDLKSESESEQERLGRALQELQSEKEHALNQIQQLDSRILDLSSVRETLEQNLRLKTEDLAQWTQLAEQSEAKSHERQEKINELEKSKADLEVQRDDLFLSKAQLEDQRDKLLFIKAELESERVAFSDQLVEMTGVRDRLAQAKQALESKAASLESQRQSLSVELEKTRQIAAEQNTAWKDKHAALEATSTREQEALLEKQIQLEDSVEQLKTEKAEALHEIDTLESRIHDLDTKSGSLEQDLRLKTEELAQWTQLAEQSEAKAEERQTKIDSLETARRELESEKEILTSVKESLAEHRDQLLGANASLENERDELLAAKAQLENNLTELGQKLSELTSARQELEEWKENLETEVVKLEERSRRLAAELDERTKELELARLEGNDQDAQWNAKYNELKTASETEQTRLGQTIAGLKDEKATALSQIQQLERQMGEVSTARKNLEQDLRLKTEELAQWTQLAEQSEAKAEERQTTIDSLHTERDQLSSDKAELTDDRDRLMALKNDLEQEREAWLAANKQIEKERNLLSQKLSELTATEQKLAGCKEDLEAEVAELQNRSHRLTVELDQRVQELEVARLEGKDQDAQWNAKYTELKAAAEAKQERLGYLIDRLKDDKETASNIIQQLEIRISDLTNDRAAFSKELYSKTEELARWTQLAEQSALEAKEAKEKIESLNAERNYLFNEKEALVEGRDQLEAAKNNLETDRDALLAAKAQLESERMRFANKLAEVSEIRDGLEQQKKKTESELKKLEVIVQKLKTDLENRTHGLAEAQLKNKQDSEVWSDKFNELKNAAQVEREILLTDQGRLKSELQKMTEQQLAAMTTIAGFEATINSFEERCQQSDLELQKKSQDLQQWAQLAEQVEAKAESWHKQVDMLEKAKRSLESQCDALRAAKTQLDSERQATVQKLLEMTEEKEKAIAQGQNLQMELQEMRSQQSLLQETLSAKQKELEQSVQSRKDSDTQWSEKFQELSSETSVESQTLSVEIDKLKSSIKNLKIEKNNALKEIEEWEKLNESLEHNRIGLEQELNVRTAELKKLSDWSTQTEARAKEQQKKMESLEASKADIQHEFEALLETQKGFETDLRDSTAELSRLTQRIEHADIAAELAAKRTEELEAAKNEAEDRCQKLVDEVGQMAREKKTLVQQVVEIQAGLNSLEMENSLSSLESRRKFLETELDSRAKEVEKWMESAKLAENETQKVKEERQAFTKKYEALEKKCSALEAELKPLQNAQKQIGQKEKEIARLEAELKTVADLRDSAVLEAKLLVNKNEEKFAVSAQDWDQRYAVLKTAITREREGFERERAELQKKQDELRKLDYELSQSRDKINELEASRNELQKKLTDLQSEAARHSKGQPDQDQIGIRQDLDSARQEIKKLSAKYHALEEIKNEFVGLLGSERERYDSLQGQYDQLKDRFGELVRKQTESVSFDPPLTSGKKQSSAPSGGDNSDTEKMLRLKQILDFEDNRRGSKESDSK